MKIPRHTCIGKQRYLTDRSAKVVVREMGYGSTYSCRLCKGWHVTSQEKPPCDCGGGLELVSVGGRGVIRCPTCKEPWVVGHMADMQALAQECA